MRKPGVLVIHNRYQLAGGEDAVVRAEVALLRRHGHRVTEFVRDNAVIARLGPLRQAALFATTTWNQTVYRELRQLIRRERPQIAHCHNLVPLISPAAYYACREEGVPVVQTLHNFRLRCPAGTMFHHGAACGNCSGELQKAVALGCYRGSPTQTAAVALMLAAHRSLNTYRQMVDAYSAPSAFCAAQVACSGIPRQRIVVRPNFLLNDPGPRTASQNFALFVGRLCEEKGVRQLLQAWPRLPHVPLVIVGDGPLRAELQCADLPNVSLSGALSPADTLAKIKAARFLIFPSIGYETFGMAVLESAACGVATIASRLGALPELVHEGQTGLLFDPSNCDELVDKIHWAWSHPVTINQMGAAARRRYLQHFTAERAYEDLIALYRELSPEFADLATTTGAVA